MASGSRRSVLAATAGFVAAGVAGCLGAGGDDDPAADTDPTTPDGSSVTGTDGTTGASALPTRDTALHVPDSAKRLREHVVGGGPGKDGIPSVDDPRFEPVGDVGDRINPEMPVFGVDVDGEAKAYPQYVLVWHEVANDVVGGRPLAVTYCPLTGTALAFERGAVEFGVSGRLVNSNLVLYDRATDSRWPQVLGTAIDGEFQGTGLRQVPTTWTTWERWKAQHPDGLVLTEDTGHVRDYGRDPYGDYNPTRGYYASTSFLFAPMRESDRLQPKAVVHGVRSSDGAFAVSEPVLRRERVVAGSAGSLDVVAAYDPATAAGVAYANPGGASVAADGDGYRVGGGDAVAATELPLPRLPSFDAMFFAWYAFYPDSEFVLADADANSPGEVNAR
ncbi:DUF3179 domain-containing protein [Halorubellus sp. PRR65]|uniref:DUF3179 domain-containing protein n=1 Tax=Halorubellus sp. PRR65 TaxID=3098148 RepID=UPI002B25C05A|nr:DUF3179 domain-containing protein [Halorubellus sp. PRR65]